jgi:hypothetical protein
MKRILHFMSQMTLESETIFTMYYVCGWDYKKGGWVKTSQVKRTVSGGAKG